MSSRSPISETLGETRQLTRELGWVFVASLFLRAYSLGGGTYTGIEAVSNNVQSLADIGDAGRNSAADAGAWLGLRGLIVPARLFPGWGHLYRDRGRLEQCPVARRYRRRWAKLGS